MVERRDVLRGTAAFAAAALVGERVSAAKDDGALDLALERFARTGPEYGGGLANHGPMAAEALVALGRPDAVARWVEGYASRLGPPPPARGPIPSAQWDTALGERGRVADWLVFFSRELAEAPCGQGYGRFILGHRQHIREYPVHPLHDFRLRAEVREERQWIELDAGQSCAPCVQKQAHLRIAEAVDGLHRIADDEHRAPVALLPAGGKSL
jgi:hypothetical protein